MPEDAVKVTQGEPKIYASSEHGRRHFCANCGTGLFYVNDATCCPGSSTCKAAPMTIPMSFRSMAHIQIAERIGWMERAHELPVFERYPPQT